MKEKMNRSRKSKAENRFLYKRVDLPHEQDSTDSSEDDLDRLLGPSSNSNKPWKKKNKCLIYCSLFMLLLTFTILGGVVIFATVTYPGGIQEALNRVQMFKFDKEYGTKH